MALFQALTTYILQLQTNIKFILFNSKFIHFNFFINNENLDKDKLLKCFDILIFKDDGMKENNVNDIFKRLNRILHNRNYLRNLNTAKNNWLELPIDDVVRNVLYFFETIQFAEL